MTPKHICKKSRDFHHRAAGATKCVGVGIYPGRSR